MVEKKESLFPHKEIREIQDKLLHKVDEVLKEKKHLIVHAPTGLGKTAATLAPALAFAMKNSLTVFFLTSRHTQHLIAIETLKKIKESFDTKFIVTDIIGKKWMCPVEGTDSLYSSEFYDYCKKQREDNLCEFYENTKAKGKISEKAKHVLKQLEQLQPCDSEKVVELCTENKLCPYEMSIALAAKSHIIIGDYHQIFHPSISQTFLAKIDKKLDEAIIIVDEGHNLPVRVRDLASDKLSSYILNRALKEAKKMGFNETKDNIEGVQAVLEELSLGVDIGSEKKIKQKDFIDRINDYKEYETMAADLEFVGDDIRKMQKQSFVGAVARFMEIWQQADEGFTRIISKTASKYGDNINLNYRCLDPSLLTKDVIKASYSTILMSGTLTPTEMYHNLLGFPENTEEEAYGSPFPNENRLNLIIPRTTTKFTCRSTGQYQEIAKICADIVK